MPKKIVERKDKSYQRLKDRQDIVKADIENKEADIKQLEVKLGAAAE